MIFSVVMLVEVERPQGEFDHAVAVPVKLTCRSGKWQGICEDPPIITEWLDTLEQSLVASAHMIVREWQSGVVAQ